MDYNSYRTPEQKAALELQKEQISNNMDVLKQSQMNDLALYNKYATAKLQNQLNYEMQDLTVTDPKQLRANLSNVLDQWYSQY
jgi:protein-tyrosine phosphatase